ncbi:MAG: sugar phosphate isomerase/epimerase [Lentisphaeria bacterium]|nr:sugar phosphate isomerase/epimerase [Lentisphaeria bacterium]
MSMDIGISQLICADMGIEEFLSAAKTAGYESVELAMKKETPLSGSTTDGELAAIVEQAKTHAVSIDSITIGHCTGNLLDQGEAQARSIEETAFALEAASKLGASAALHTLGSLRADLYYDDAYRNAVDSLKALAPTAERLGVDLAFEFVWNGFLFSPMEVRRFLDEVGSASVGFYFDPGNMAVFQFPQHWVRIIGHHIKRVHLKDWRGRALNGAWTPLLEGEVDFAAVMGELHAAGYDGPLVSEVSTSLASLEATAQAMRTIRAL